MASKTKYSVRERLHQRSVRECDRFAVTPQRWQQHKTSDAAGCVPWCQPVGARHPSVFDETEILSTPCPYAGIKRNKNRCNYS
ncbi:hypothetical protein [Microseira wollei]|uniref:hypothetical protein n=1 Tax=Microseira wollei TaxID=467598 RepID=UPI001CFD42E4|nr:hypothetical protein [Microseira wollei]